VENKFSNNDFEMSIYYMDKLSNNNQPSNLVSCKPLRSVQPAQKNEGDFETGRSSRDSYDYNDQLSENKPTFRATFNLMKSKSSNNTIS
jgi:hypothetical protein